MGKMHGVDQTKMFEAGKTVEKGFLVAVRECRKCGLRTTGDTCKNCYLVEKWDEARRDSIEEWADEI